MTREIETRDAVAIAELAETANPDLPTVLIAHLMADKAKTSGSEYYAAIVFDPVYRLGTIANPAFDYVALGHVHKFQDLNRGHQPPVF